VGKVANGWSLNGITVLQSGMPYNAYDYSGAVNGLFYGGHSGTPLDPILPLKPGITVGQAQLQGSTGYNINQPFLNSADFYAPHVAPGTNGVTTTCGTTCDTFETTYGATSRNTFRGPFQSRFDVAMIKQTRLSERFTLRFQADAFNALNHPSFDAPNTSTSLYSVSSAGVPTVRTASTSFGFVQRTIGSPRFLQLSMSLMF
jgi:hypothetical protein